MKNVWIVFHFGLLRVILLSTFAYKSLYGYMFLYLLGIYLGMELMSIKVTLYLTLTEIHSHKKCMWLTICPHTFQHYCCLFLLKPS